MIMRHRMMLVAVAAMLSTGIAAPAAQQRTQPDAAAPTAAPRMHGLPGYQPGLLQAGRNPILVSSREDDWTAQGGAMRGLDK